ncbi:hypothetical protein [Pyxidicoccus sp. MSG2]|uniref:hypothetical protein n=1 Tax=Pyxidicoccus sp. MSG2 TaxID=2996790 RepID=UPI0022716BE0|nr:hypothetical protein [Pyxidicoccus sp. MSG2]MCY1014673.1 hypothetical protein [Pyxidicoccus sp. MSG2]
MPRLLAVLFVCALLPRQALAQDTASPAPADDVVVAPPLVPAPEQVEPESFPPTSVQPEPMKADEGIPAAPRIVLETLSGGAGMLVGGLAGLVAGVVTTECSLFETDCTTAALFGLSGMALGATFSTWGVGKAMRGRGGFLGTLVGALLGTGAGLFALSVDDDTLGPIGLLSLPALGAVVGFELSGSMDPGPASHFSLTGGRVPVTPAFGTTPHGGFMGGVVGRF